RLRSVLYGETRAAFAQVDLLALPTTPIAAPRLDQLTVRSGGRDVSVMETLARLTAPFNMTGLPALSVPCGFTQAGTPVGLKRVGGPLGEAALLAAGHAYQRGTGWHLRRPTLAS